ncbi:MAG: guanylate kinase [Paludibacteraceae bacterium]|jgi:guanylate kinase|nr:guanylate kinase [Paludibacteraceae bacterium]MDD6358297.1 guanylate kinase [Bacteroidales bacterium]
MNGKLVIFSAPSGSGKSTIINHLLKKGYNLEFSISATSRKPRGSERNGVEYYFLSPEEFRQKIAGNEFIEYEEVYQDCFYGTLKSEIERIAQKGNNTVLDIDVKGAANVKKQFGERALSIFIAPPSIEALRERLINRKTDTMEAIEKRVAKASYEMTFAKDFDIVIVNDDLQTALADAENVLKNFLG